jgi:hypothetical protein
VTGAHNAKGLRRAALTVMAAALCVPGCWARGQREGAARPAPRAAAPHFQAPRTQPGRPQGQGRANQQFQGRPQGGQAPVYPGIARPNTGYPNSGSAYGSPNYETPGRPGYLSPRAAPPGHLGDWLNQHRGLPVQDQERLLRSDPNFNRLPPANQQRLLQQLHSVNQMPEQQRERTLARNEAIERLSPQQRMGLNQSAQRLAAMPPERKALVRRAFQDLRAVPLEQRETVLNSARYQGVFSPEERGVLSDFLRVEPYEPVR